MRRKTGLAVLLAASIGLSACGGAMGPGVFKDNFWSGSAFSDSHNSTARGLGELAQGNYIVAEKNFQASLKKNPQDADALLGLGMIYQNNGQTTKARQMYEAILALRPGDTEQFVIWKNLKTRPVSEIASVNLALIESGGVLTSMGREPGVQPPLQEMQPIGAAPRGSAMTARMMPSTMNGVAPTMATGMLPFAEASTNILSRFKTLMALRDQGLITGEEYSTRRQANAGALLPLSAPPPAAGLDRPVPSTEQISGRLRAIGRGLEMRAITISQHAAERSMILDALMPAAPVTVANPGMPPQGLLEAADDVRWLEQLRAGGIITSDEYARERKAIERVMQPAPPPQPAMKMTMPMASGSQAEMEAGVTRLSGPQPALHLASYRSLKDAERGWSQLRRAHKSELAGLESEISKVNLGPKGTFYRLKAGPLADKAEAVSLCKKLKRKRQFCEATFMNAG
ncbi:MAG: tetratricopeptide repeat protein [Alphaproteobacteria bacterium]